VETILTLLIPGCSFWARVYRAPPIPLAFGAGNTSVTLIIGINQDSLVEGNEKFTVELSNPRGGATLVAPSVATVTIVDDESTFQFSARTFTATEGTATAVITVLRTGAGGNGHGGL